MEKMWTELAGYYDLMYSWKSYREEADRIISLVRKYKKSPGKDLLDVGCGTGEHFRYLRRHFSVIGMDKSGAMLDVARGKFPGITFVRQDMMSLRLRMRFDVIVCLFAAIAYTRTYANLRRTIDRFSEHLVDGGVVIIEPFVHPRSFIPNFTDGMYVDRPELKFCRLIKSSKRGTTVTLDSNFLVATKAGIKRYHDIHRLGCFAPERVLPIMRECGLRARYLARGLMPGRGLYVGVKGK